MFDGALPEVYGLLKHITHASSCGEDDVYARLITDVLEFEWKQEREGFSATVLPIMSCTIAGGEIEKAIPVAAGWRALYVAAKLMDDVEDGDRVNIADKSIPAEIAINLGTGFIGLANLAFLVKRKTHHQLDEKAKIEIGVEFNRTMLHMASGQHRDISIDNPVNMEEYREIMSAKSGSFFQLATWAGARCATDDETILSLFEMVGYNLGMMLQLNDDLKDFQQKEPGNDIERGRVTFPLLYAFSVASPYEKKRLQELMIQATHDTDAANNVRELVRMLGGEMYVLAEIMRYRRRTLRVLDEMKLSKESRREMEKWLSILSIKRKYPHQPNNNI